MVWILATRGASTKPRSTPFTEIAIEGVHSVVYKPGVESVVLGGGAGGDPGTFAQGLHRISGYVFSYHGSVAEALLGITDEIDLIVRYRGSGQRRKRTLADVIFIGDAAVTVPSVSSGVSTLIGVPFRVQIPDTDTLDDHVTDEADT